MHVVLSVFAIVLSLILVVGIHEAGHAWVAYLFKVKIHKISIGFGRALATWKGNKGYSWVWSMWPLGGYVQLLNSRIEPIPRESYPYAFDKKPIWVRCVILLSGAVANVFLAWIALVFLLVLGYQQTRPVVDSVKVPSMASLAGIADGDKILRFADIPVSSWRDVGMQLVMTLGEQDVTILTENEAGKTHTIRLDLSKVNLHQANQSLLETIGITPDLSEKNNQQMKGLSWLQALPQAFFQMIEILHFFFVLLKQLLTGMIPFAVLLGPLGLFNMMANTLLQGLTVFLYFIASLSLSVALVNLLPIPGLDGGSILYAVIEKIRKKPITVAMEILLHRLFFIAFCLILVQLLLNDLQRYLR